MFSRSVHIFSLFRIVCLHARLRMKKKSQEFIIVSVESEDIRWPTSLHADGSDAMHTDPDYSCVYVTLRLNNNTQGNGLTFTLGRGTEVVKAAVDAMKHLVMNLNCWEIFDDFRSFWRSLTSESQLRWIGPEKGVTHLALAAIVNALWDLWAKLEGKPVWRLLVDMEPEHTDPDYSCVYVTLRLNNNTQGNGLTFTLGRGTEVVKAAVDAMKHLVMNLNCWEIFDDFRSFWRSLTSESQLRWIGPEKGVTHLALAAIVNALWDLWAKLEGKPVWRLLVDMEPEKLISCIDFRYISDVLSPEEAIRLLKQNADNKDDRIMDLMENGYPAYTTQVGWLGYSDDKIDSLCKEYLAKGYTAFKVKVGRDFLTDFKRCKLVREAIGWDNLLMIDANQVWNVNEAIDWVSRLAEFKPLWIEEPTSPDDVFGHAAISRALRPLGIGVATGEMCANRVMFKQFLQSGAMQYCQIDSARIGGVNEILSVYLMAKKLNVKVCPHAGGVGLCEMVQHLQMWDYVSLSATKASRMIEYIDQQHDQFVHPVVIKNACYMPPTQPGYSTLLKDDAIEEYKFPNGSYWKTISE